MNVLKKSRILLKHCDKAIRKYLCSRGKYGSHKYYVGSSGHFPGMPQAHCWRCGKTDPHGGGGIDDNEPLGGWFS